MGRLFKQIRLFAVVMTFIPAASAAPTVVLGFELSDRSLDGEVYGVNDRETQRLQLLTEQLQTALEKSALFTVVDATVMEETIAAQRPFSSCNGCDIGIARALGAKWSIYGVVEKISNLILDMRLVLRDADSGRVLFAERIGIRGNDDKSWQNGLRWLLENRLLAVQ